MAAAVHRDGGALVRFVPNRLQPEQDGKKLCKVCHAPLPPRRWAYCSDECWHRNSPSIMRSKVWKRDRGVCALCGLDTKTVECRWEADHIVPVAEGGGLCGLDGYRTLCKGCHGKASGELRKRLNARKAAEKAQKETGRLFA